MDETNQSNSMDEKECENQGDAYIGNGSLNFHEKPTIKRRTGGWRCGALLLGIYKARFKQDLN